MMAADTLSEVSLLLSGIRSCRIVLERKSRKEVRKSEYQCSSDGRCLP
jgi:hypothetical protein